MITNNEDIIGQMSSYVESITSYKEVKFLYKDVLLELSVLDPSVGSGAFLFAALNILLPIYQKAVFKMKEFAKTQDDEWLHETILTLSHHAEEYYLTKQIILNNLYGVDIVEEATEICKLRLFLQLASHLPDITSIEPLPDIDFNIYAGNSLVGGLSWEDLEANYTMDLFTSMNRDNIKADIKTLSDFKNQYRTVQQLDENEEDLVHLKNQIDFLKDRINRDTQIEIENPFHWFINFDAIINKGGFDIIIGNPPYVEYTKKNAITKRSVKDNYQIKSYKTEDCGNLYAYFIERAYNIINDGNYFGMIIPISSITTSRADKLQSLLLNNTTSYFSSFSNRPAKLFDGVEQRLVIFISKKELNNENVFYSSKYNHWYADERELLFSRIKYSKIKFDKRFQSIAKIGDRESPIFEKIYKQPILTNFLLKKSNHCVYFHDAPTYWIRAFTFRPSGVVEGKTSHYKQIYLDNENNCSVLNCILNSSLFYLFFKSFSNCRDFSIREINSFPFDLNKLAENEINNFVNLSNDLEANYKENRKISSRAYPTGTVEFEEYYPKYSKSIIDKIDKCLAEIYGLSNEELEYIVNYDLKYRLGSELEEQE